MTAVEPRECCCVKMWSEIEMGHVSQLNMTSERPPIYRFRCPPGGYTPKGFSLHELVEIIYCPWCGVDLRRPTKKADEKYRWRKSD